MKRALPLLFAVAFLTACATNPATGRSELNFYSEEQEIAMGREAHDEIIEQYGVYDEKPALNEMIDRIGHDVAASSPRPNLPWTFTLLDTPMVNAMALPGGYIYITRGILERLNSEDELAGVIGHEVAHVAARHSTHSMSTGTMAQVGLVAAMVLAGEENTEKYGALAMIGAGLLFTKYSRQQETEADILGTRYMSKTGFNPLGAENMLLALQRLGGSPGLLERYFMDHPDPAKRVNDVRREIATLATADAAVGQRNVDRHAFIRSLEGMLTGNNTSDTTIRQNTVYNRSHGLVARAPRGWRAVVESGSLFALYRENGEGVVYAQELDDEELDAQLEELGLQHDDSANARAATGERLTIDYWSGSDEDGTEYEVASTQHGNVAFLHIAKAGNGGEELRDLVEDLSFDRKAANAIKPPRLRVLQARKGDTWQTLAKRATGNADDASETAAINGFDFPGEVPAGLMVKLPEEVAKPVE